MLSPIPWPKCQNNSKSLVKINPKSSPSPNQALYRNPKKRKKKKLQQQSLVKQEAKDYVWNFFIF